MHFNFLKLLKFILLTQGNDFEIGLTSLLNFFLFMLLVDDHIKVKKVLEITSYF